MITEDFISFEIAKLLKEKGYNGPSVFYDEEDAYRWNSENSIEVPNPNYDPSIPFDTETFRECLPHITLAMAMKWLREEKKLSIIIDICFDDDRNRMPGYFYDIWYLAPKYDCFDTPIHGFDTYEEAAEAAIKYCLENLI